MLIYGNTSCTLEQKSAAERRIYGANYTTDRYPQVDKTNPYFVIGETCYEFLNYLVSPAGKVDWTTWISTDGLDRYTWVMLYSVVLVSLSKQLLG